MSNDSRKAAIKDRYLYVQHAIDVTLQCKVVAEVQEAVQLRWWLRPATRNGTTRSGPAGKSSSPLVSTLVGHLGPDNSSFFHLQPQLLSYGDTIGCTAATTWAENNASLTVEYACKRYVLVARRS